MLPSKSWAAYDGILKAVGERRPMADEKGLDFLTSLGLVEGAATLTAEGEAYFRARFIDDSGASATAALGRQVLVSCPEAAAIAQLLANRPRVPRSVAETVLRSQGYGDRLTDRRIGSLLALMDRAGVITYFKREAAFEVIAKPLSEPLPDSVFISPETPWSNRAWLMRILGDCSGSIAWLDKHFLPEGLDLLGQGADGSRLSSIRVLSLGLDENTTRRAKRAYRDVTRELATRGISFEWRFIDSKEVRQVHDRWIVSESRAWNVPNLNAILSGQHSELVASGNAKQLLEMFDGLWECAPERPATPSD